MATSEFFERLKENIVESLYTPIYDSVAKNIEELFDDLNQNISSAANNIIAGPQAWNSSAYGIMQTVAENICIPLAGSFITVIFCWELIHLVQESNSMQSVKPDRLIITLLKFGLCLMACAYSFRIVMSFSELGSRAAHSLAGLTQTTTSITMNPTLNDLGLSNPPNEGYTIGCLMELAGYWIALKLAKLGVWICGIVVYIRTMLWFIEILLYASSAPIPYSTWMNKEWSQVGMNYTRKMLALSFEGFFILLLFSIYGGVLGGLQLGDFQQSLVMMLGCGFGLALMMFKVHNISSSIFNAH